MRYVLQVRWLWLVIAIVVLVSTGRVPASESVRLRYEARYDHQSSGPDHLMGVEAVLDHYALVSSNLALTLIDLETLPPGGTQSYVYRLPGIDAYTTVTRGDGYVYVNRRQGGLVVVRLGGSPLRLLQVGQVSEPTVFFEKMSVVGDRLYVAAHAYGIRIYSLSNPAAPSLVGELKEGFDDAFAIAVSGDTAYVADGAGGLKIVDISNEAAPTIVAGENPVTAFGTAQDVMIISEHVYVAAGGAGVAVYQLGDLESRRLYDTPVCAKHLARVGDHLAVADIGGVCVFALERDGSLNPAAGESAMRRQIRGRLSLRLWHGISTWGDNRILTANWNTMDVYRLVDPDLDDQADVTAARQRIRFAPEGGDAVVRIRNDGSGTLNATRIYCTQNSFSVRPSDAVLQSGEMVDLSIEYRGGQPGSALVLIESNDPDENPLPIQVFGETSYLDPGEPAAPFTLESWRFDHETREFLYDTFDLGAHAGKIVYFRIFGTW